MIATLPQLSRAPVVSIIGQVRFSAVLGIETQIPKIQEELRKSGFPKFELSTNQGGLRPELGGAVQMPPEYSWNFIDKNDERIVTLTTSAITLHSAKNDTPEQFDEIFFPAISIFYEHVQPALIQRIGVRWIDVIQPTEGKDFRDYIHEGLLGIPNDRIGAHSSVWHVFSFSQTESGVLFVRGRYPVVENFLPPDAVQPRLKLRLLEKRPSFVLDLDHFLELNVDFNLGTIKSTVESFHKILVDRAFVSAVRPEAIAEWR